MDFNQQCFPDIEEVANATRSQSKDTSSSTDQEEISLRQSPLDLIFAKKTDEEEGKLLQFKRQARYSQKAQSFQDLHSDYTKKRYQHVKSKVGEYIANVKIQDQLKQKITRHRSLPESLSGYNQLSNCSNDNTSKDDLLKKIFENNEEMTRLKTLNEYLREKFQEKMAQLARLKISSDSMRIELLEMKENQRKLQLQGNNLFSGKNENRCIIRTLPPEICVKISKATQTCETYDMAFDVSCQDKFDQKFMRKRTSSNSHKFQKSQLISFQNITKSLKSNGSDSAIESELEKERSEIDNGKLSDPAPEPKKRKTTTKKKWKFGSSMISQCCHRNDSPKEEYFYTRIPASETEILHVQPETK